MQSAGQNIESLSIQNGGKRSATTGMELGFVLVQLYLNFV